jgi:hypothetical protein
VGDELDAAQFRSSTLQCHNVDESFISKMNQIPRIYRRASCATSCSICACGVQFPVESSMSLFIPKSVPHEYVSPYAKAALDLSIDDWRRSVRASQ